MARARGERRDILPEIEGFVDLIFGLALSIGALILISNVPSDSSQILDDIFAFTYGFVILVFIWEEITKEMLLFKVETTWMLRITYILLFLVTLEPYLFNLITQHAAASIDEIASMLYAADLASLMVVLAFFAQKIVNGEGRQIPEAIELYRWKRQIFVFQATIFIVSMLPFFWELQIGTTRLRFILWILAPVIGLVWGLGRRYRENNAPENPAA